ncbi:MAG: S1C family serine protease [Chloroflexota bacterium]|jgi:serine protease Do
MSSLDELSGAIATVAERVGSSIVSVGRDGRGSGVVVADGQVLTNAHNLRGGEVTVTFSDGRSARGEVRGVDPDGDLAVIAVDTSGAKAVDPGAAESPSVGTPVFGAAATFGGGVRVTVGFVSSVARSFRGPGGRRISGSIEHTAPLAPGSSGGALLDVEGRLIGLNTNRIGEGFYLALPADAALRERIESLGKGESVERPRLGVAIAPNHVARRLRRSVGLPERDGILIRGVEDGSAAAAAGIVVGDLIVSAGGRAIADADDLQDALGMLNPPFDVVLVRGADEKTVTISGAKQQRTPGDA